MTPSGYPNRGARPTQLEMLTDTSPAFRPFFAHPSPRTTPHDGLTRRHPRNQVGDEASDRVVAGRAFSIATTVDGHYLAGGTGEGGVDHWNIRAPSSPIRTLAVR